MALLSGVRVKLNMFASFPSKYIKDKFESLIKNINEPQLRGLVNWDKDSTVKVCLLLLDQLYLLDE